jgi:hypothetical protein
MWDLLWARRQWDTFPLDSRVFLAIHSTSVILQSMKERRGGLLLFVSIYYDSLSFASVFCDMLRCVRVWRAQVFVEVDILYMSTQYAIILTMSVTHVVYSGCELVLRPVSTAAGRLRRMKQFQ